MFNKTATSDAALAYLEPARLRAEWWRLPVTLILAIAIYIGFYFTLLTLCRLVLGADGSATLTAMLASEFATSPPAIVFLLMTFGGMFLGIFLAVYLVHHRGLITLFGVGPKTGIRNFTIATGIVVLLFAIFSVIFPHDEPMIPNLPFASWIKWMAIGLPLIWVQITAEELIFRGYLQQQLAVFSPSRLVWWVVPSILFGLLHYSAANYGEHAWLVVAQTTIIALVAADITMRTGNLWAAMGLHFGNNVLGMTLISLDGMLSGLALYVTPYTIDDLEIIGMLLRTEVAISTCLFIVYMLVAHRLDDRR